jgi:pimeloyl-ACP methyl ester carboxylesterase
MILARLRLLPFIALLVAVLLLGSSASRSSAQDFAPTFEPAPCMFEGIDLGLTTMDGEAMGFDCGYVTVPVRHENPDGPTLRLPVAIRPATSAVAQEDPLFLAQGGPGGDAFAVFTLLEPPTAIAAERDLVIFNQRGTQYSEPDLSCPETYDVLPETLAADADTAEQIYNNALQACYDRLVSEGVDVSAFNSLQNAADVESIRRALGYDEYNFYGVSYGTLLGLHLMQQNPEGLRSVILDSVAPTDINFVSEVANSENRIYDALFAACEADPACRDAYPNLEARTFALFDQLDENPVTLTLRDPDTGARYEALVDGRSLRSIVYQLLYVPRMPAVFPKMITDLEAGDYRYLEAMWPLFAFDQTVSEGMYFSVICAEDADIDVAALQLDSLRPAIAESAREDLQAYIDSCALWPVDQLPSSVDNPVFSDIPTLLLSGAYDPITPPAFAEAVAAGLPNSFNLVDPTAGHGVAFQNDCVNGIMQAFLDDPTTEPDSSCLARLAAPEVIPPDTIVLPVMADVNQLDTGLLAQAGLGGVLLAAVLSGLAIWPLVYLVRAIQDKHPVYEATDRRWRWISRMLMMAFGLLALVFVVALAGFVGSSLVDLTYATAAAVSGSAAPLLWLPLVLLVLAIGIVTSAIVLWQRPGTGSTAGKVYYTVLTVCAVGILVLLGMQGLLLPPL